MDGAFILTDGYFSKNNDKIFTSGIFEKLLIREPVRSIRNQLMFWNEHMMLINFQLQLLNRQIPVFMTHDAKELKRQVERTLVKNKLFKSARVDLFFFKNDEKTGYAVKTTDMESAGYELNQEGISLAPFHKITKANSPLSSLRSGSEPYWNILQAYRPSATTELILQNTEGCLLEVPERNLYLICKKKVHTTAPESGAYISPAKKIIQQICEEKKLPFIEQLYLSPDDLLGADEVFLAGSLHGIQWVKGFEMKRYLSKITREIHQAFLHKTSMEK